MIVNLTNIDTNDVRDIRVIKALAVALGNPTEADEALIHEANYLMHVPDEHPEPAAETPTEPVAPKRTRSKKAKTEEPKPEEAPVETPAETPVEPSKGEAKDEAPEAPEKPVEEQAEAPTDAPKDDQPTEGEEPKMTKAELSQAIALKRRELGLTNADSTTDGAPLAAERSNFNNFVFGISKPYGNEKPSLLSDEARYKFYHEKFRHICYDVHKGFYVSEESIALSTETPNKPAF